MARDLILNVFIHASPALTSGEWSHPLDESKGFDTIEYWQELARIAERGKFNAVFFADYLAYYDVYKGPNNWKLPASGGYFIPKIDPGVLVSAMAEATTTLGFGITFSTVKEDPELFAKRLWSLDHATKGRVGWNIVTSYAPAVGRQLLNGGKLPSHQERYDNATAYVDTVVRSIVGQRHSKWPQSPQRLPFLIQAGTSSQGKFLGIENAEAIFINAWDRAKANADIKSIRHLAVHYGRDPKDVKILTMATPVVAITKEDAEKKVELIRQHVFQDAPGIGFGGQSHIDLDQFEWDEPIVLTKTEGGQSVTQNYIKRYGKYQTKRQIIDKGLKVTSLVGTPIEIADWFEGYLNEVDIDGFNLIFPVNHESLADFVNLIVPELQKRGLFRKEYAVPGGTFRQNAYGDEAKTYFPKSHPIHNTSWNGESKEEYDAKVKSWDTKRRILQAEFTAK